MTKAVLRGGAFSDSTAAEAAAAWRRSFKIVIESTNSDFPTRIFTIGTVVFVFFYAFLGCTGVRANG